MFFNNFIDRPLVSVLVFGTKALIMSLTSTEFVWPNWKFGKFLFGKKDSGGTEEGGILFATFLPAPAK